VGPPSPASAPPGSGVAELRPPSSLSHDIAELYHPTANHLTSWCGFSYLGAVMDKILFEDIRLDIQVGVTEEERSAAQPCGLDLNLYLKLRPAGKSGELQKSVDYTAVYRCVEDVCTRRPYTLLEEVTELLCAEILKHFPIKKVLVKVRKLQPFSRKLKAIGVEIQRSQKNAKKNRHK
jgi:FolB domain-containing protein